MSAQQKLPSFDYKKASTNDVLDFIDDHAELMTADHWKTVIGNLGLHCRVNALEAVQDTYGVDVGSGYSTALQIALQKGVGQPALDIGDGEVAPVADVAARLLQNGADPNVGDLLRLAGELKEQSSSVGAMLRDYGAVEDRNLLQQGMRKMAAGEIVDFEHNLVAGNDGAVIEVSPRDMARLQGGMAWTQLQAETAPDVYRGDIVDDRLDMLREVSGQDWRRDPRGQVFLQVADAAKANDVCGVLQDYGFSQSIGAGGLVEGAGVVAAMPERVLLEGDDDNLRNMARQVGRLFPQPETPSGRTMVAAVEERPVDAFGKVKAQGVGEVAPEAGHALVPEDSVVEMPEMAALREQLGEPTIFGLGAMKETLDRGDLENSVPGTEEAPVLAHEHKPDAPNFVQRLVRRFMPTFGS